MIALTRLIVKHFFNYFFQNREKALLSCDSFINIPPYIPIVKHIFGRYFVYIIGVSYIVYVYVSYN